MGFAEAVIAFIVIGLPVMGVILLTARVMRHRERKLELEAEIAKAQAAQRSPREAQLEQRVRVLERIVTEKGVIVADEIERLRAPTD